MQCKPTKPIKPCHGATYPALVLSYTIIQTFPYYLLGALHICATHAYAHCALCNSIGGTEITFASLPSMEICFHYYVAMVNMHSYYHRGWSQEDDGGK